MQSVQPAAVALAPRRARRSALVALAVALAGAVAAAGVLVVDAGSEQAAPASVRPLGVIAGAPLQRARCTDWLAASTAERAGAAAGLAAMVGGPTPAGPATTLTAAEAERVLGSSCSSAVRANFLLYEIYIRAAAFHSFLPPG